MKKNKTIFCVLLFVILGLFSSVSAQSGIHSSPSDGSKTAAELEKGEAALLAKQQELATAAANRDGLHTVSHESYFSSFSNCNNTVYSNKSSESRRFPSKALKYDEHVVLPDEEYDLNKDEKHLNSEENQIRKLKAGGYTSLASYKELTFEAAKSKNKISVLNKKIKATKKEIKKLLQ